METKEYPKLSSLNLKGYIKEQVGDFVLFYKCSNNEYNVDTKDKNGFDFKCYDWFSSGCDYKNHWDDPDITVYNVVNGWAAFDGIRHMHWGEDDNGYINYPKMRSLIQLLQRLEELSISHCWEYELYDNRS